MDKRAPKRKVSLFKNDKITLVRSTGAKMPGRITALSTSTFWVKYKNPGRWEPDSKIGDIVNMVLHYENYELPFTAKVIERYHPGDIAVDVCYEAGEDLELVQRHEQYRKSSRFPVYIRKSLNIHDHSDFVTRPRQIPKDIKDMDIHKFTPCKSLDISGSGMRIQTETPLEKGAPLEVVFSIDGHNIVASASVKTKQQRRSSVFEYGIHFDKIHPENVKKIIKYVYKDEKEGTEAKRSIFSFKK